MVCKRIVLIAVSIVAGRTDMDECLTSYIRTDHFICDSTVEYVNRSSSSRSIDDPSAGLMTLMNDMVGEKTIGGKKID